MNAKRLIVTMVFAIILIGFFIWIIGVFIDDAARKNRIWREQSQKVTDAMNYIDSKKYDVMFYGDELNAPKAFIARRINDFDPESLTGPDGLPEHVGHMIIINDINGNSPIEAGEWNRLHTLLLHENYVIIYLGSSQLKKMQDAGFFFDVYPESTRSVVFWDSGKGMEIGFADDASIVPEVVREGLTPEQLPVYTMLMKIQKDHYI